MAAAGGNLGTAAFEESPGAARLTVATKGTGLREAVVPEIGRAHV